MGFDFGDLKKLLLDKGLPTIAGAMTGGTGGGIISTLANLFGKDPKDPDVMQELASKLNDPQAIIEFRRIEADLSKAALAHELALKQADFADDADRRDLIKSETASEDPYVRRARPTFLWIMYVVIAYNFIIRPTIGIWVGGVTMLAFPADLYWLFGSAYLGYTAAREVGKKGGITEVLGGLKKMGK